MVLASLGATICRLEIIGKLVKNAACSPNDDKYKSVKTSNPKIHSLIIDTPGALDAMKELGWAQEEETLRCEKPLTMAHVRPTGCAHAHVKLQQLVQNHAPRRNAAAKACESTRLVTLQSTRCACSVK